MSVVGATVRLAPSSLQYPRWGRAVGEPQPHVLCGARERSAREGIFSGGLDQDIAALERPLRIVGGQRERQPLELARAALAAVEQRRVGLALKDEQPPLGHLPF